MRICSVSNCTKKHYGKDLCQNHYDLLRKHGSPLINVTEDRKRAIKKLLPSWIEEYNKGHTTTEIAKNYGYSDATVWKYLKPTGIIRSQKLIKRAEGNPQWKGEKASSHAIHKWIRTNYEKPTFCQSCNERPALDLANISNSYNPLTYTRDISNWEWLCRRCHMLKDGRLENFYKNGKKWLVHTREDVNASFVQLSGL